MERHREAQAARVHPRGRQRRRDLLAGRAADARGDGLRRRGGRPRGAGQPVDFPADCRRDGRKAAVEPTTEEKFDVLRRHLHALAQLKGEAVAVREMRRHIVCYVRGMRDAARLRVKVNAITDIGEMEEALKAFMLEGKA